MFPLIQKSDAYEDFINFVEWAEKKTGRQVQRLSADNDGVFVSKRFQAFLAQQHIDFEPTPPHTPELNLVVE